jgi:nitrogen fixation protein NifU and related proteins
MNDLRELYQEVILDHSRKPRNFGALADATAHAEGYNPLCGDHYHLHARLDGPTLCALGFEGAGCAISKASASMLTQALTGRSETEARVLFEAFHAMVTGAAPADAARLGKLAVFAGVCEFPARVKCASLAWHTLMALLDRRHDAVTTE